MVGNLSADFPNCPEGSSSGGGSRSSNGGEGETKIEVGDMELETTSDVTDTKMRKAKSGIGQTTMNLSEKGAIGGVNNSVDASGSVGKSGNTISAQIRAARKKANAKIGDIRKLTLKRKKSNQFFKTVGRKT